MSYRKIMEKLILSRKKWLPLDRVGIAEDEKMNFAEFVRRESGGLLEILYDRDPDSSDTYVMLVMRIKDLSEGELRRFLGIDRYTSSFLLFLLFEDIQGKTYVAAEDIVHMLRKKGIEMTNSSLKKLISKLEEHGLIRVKESEEDNFTFIRPTELLRRIVDTSKIMIDISSFLPNISKDTLDTIIGRDNGETN